MRFSDTIIPTLEEIAIKIQVGQDHQSKIWAFLDPSNEYKLPQTISFGDDSFNISIIDQFDQHRPQLMNSWSMDDRQVGLIPAIILDSNSMSFLHQYVVEPARLSAVQKKAVRDLIGYLAFTNYDYNPFFYYLETFTKIDIGVVTSPKIVQMTESIIRLQSMDQLLFLKTGEIKPDTELFQRYIEKFDVSSYPEMAIKQVDWLHSKNTFAFAEIENLFSSIYICLLKMALIRLQSKKSIKHKHIQLRNYMVDTLGVVFSRELYIALIYFAGMIETFIPLKEGSNFEKMRSRLKAAAWDALLMRLPEFYLSEGGPEPVTLAYICTADKALQKIAKGIRIKAVLSLMPHPHSPRSLLNFDYAELTARVGTNIVDEILMENDDWLANRWFSNQSEQANPREEGLQLIIQNLESEMRLLCR